MTAAIIICAMFFIGSVFLIQQAFKGPLNAEAGHIASLVLLTGLIGLAGSTLTFAFINGMIFARWLQ